MVPLELLSLVRVGIYNRSFTNHTAVLVKLPKAFFESAECAPSFENEPTREEVFRKACNKSMRKAGLRQL